MTGFETFVQTNETAIRLGFFIGIFGLMALWEILAPRRAWKAGRGQRWPSNIAIVIVDSLVVRLLFPIVAVGAATWAETQGYGLMNVLELPLVIAIILCVIIMDGVIYGQHVVFHKVPVLWRLHRMHHADTGFDVTTALRFHPIEIVISMGIKIAVVVAIGAPALAVVIFEVLLNGSAMFNHGNVKLPNALDRALRLVIVTPDMHRVHHSAKQPETDSNYGFCLSVWDRLFGSYREQPEGGQDGFTIGLEYFRKPEQLRLDQLLIQPFKTPNPPGSTTRLDP